MGPNTSSVSIARSNPRVSETTLFDTEIHSMTIFVNTQSSVFPIFSHVGIIVYPNEYYDDSFFQAGGVLIEYGDYNKDNSEDKGFYCYCSEIGLRYISTSNVLKVKGDFIPCKLLIKLTVRELLRKNM